MDHHSMPPVPKPRALHLSPLEEHINEKPKSSAPPLSQSRVRRLKQKTTATNDETPESSMPAHNVANEDEEKQSNTINKSFIAKIRANDTLARFKRESSSSPNHGPSDNGIIPFF
jgi:hypothetical protein